MGHRQPNFYNIPFKLKSYSEKYNCFFTTIDINSAEYIFPNIYDERPNAKNINLYIIDGSRYGDEVYLLKHGNAEWM